MAKTMQKRTVVEEVQPEEVVETKNKKVFAQSDGVLCVSITQGKLYVEGSKTGMLYSFSDYGDETEIEYRDLVGLIRSKDKSVFEPRFVVSDQDFIEEYPALKKFYNDEFSIKNIKKILLMPDDEMVKEIEKLPKGAADSLKSIAAEQVATGEIDSVRKIKALDAAFGTNLNLLGEMFSND